MKNIILVLLLLISSSTADAQFKFSAKLRTIQPVEITLKNLNGEIIFSGVLKSGEVFEYNSPSFVKDYYSLFLGKTEIKVLLSNSHVVLKGFYTENSSASTNIKIEGTPDNDLLKEAIYLFKNTDRVVGWNWDVVKGKYEPIVLAALIFENQDFFRLKSSVLNEFMNDCSGDTSLRGSILISYIDKMHKNTTHFVEGNNIKNFSLPAINGELISLNQFKGKYILLDFWASWCGPCVKGVEILKPIYNDVNKEKIEFISVSLDDNKDKWKQAMEKLKIPWISLWDSSGFKKTAFKEELGFDQIPFMLIISPDGKIVSRKIGIESVKNEVNKYIK